LKRREDAIPKTAHIFEVGKKVQILVANFVVERAVDILAVDRGECRGEVCEVKEIIFGYWGVLRVARNVWECVRRGC
jgi:hypothetical protein